MKLYSNQPGLERELAKKKTGSCPDKWCSSAVAKPLASAPSTAL